MPAGDGAGDPAHEGDAEGRPVTPTDGGSDDDGAPHAFTPRDDDGAPHAVTPPDDDGAPHAITPPDGNGGPTTDDLYDCSWTV